MSSFSQTLSVLVTSLILLVTNNFAATPTPFAPADWESYNDSVDAVNGPIYAMVTDGTNIYVGGDFTVAGSLSAYHIAKWNGTAWSVLDQGVNGVVRAMHMVGTTLYVGGEFTKAGNITVNHIAAWNGTAWSAVGSGTDGVVRAISSEGSSLFVGGDFTKAGTISASNIAKWDGAAWSQLGTGVDGSVRALAHTGTILFVGGTFTTAGGVATKYMAQWNSTSWAAGGMDPQNPVNAMIWTGTNLWAGSRLLMRWNGTSWTTIANTIEGYIYSFANRADLLVVGGAFTHSPLGLTTKNNIFTCNATSGSAWQPLSSGTNGSVNAIAITTTTTNTIFVGGAYGTAGGINVKNLASYSGSWSPMGSGLNGSITELAWDGENLYIGGSFSKMDALNVNGIAKWTGSSWESMNLSTSTNLKALQVYDNNLYAAGWGKAGNGVWNWDGASWSDLPNILRGRAGSAMVIAKDSIIASSVEDEDKYSFLNQGTLDGLSYLTIANPIYGHIKAMVHDGKNLYVGGDFTKISGINRANGANTSYTLTVKNVAKWDGTIWTALGEGLDKPVYSLAFHNGVLVAGGDFQNSGTTSLNRIATWNGSSWSKMGDGFDSTVTAMVSNESMLYVGGGFAKSGAVPVNHLARWNGNTWEAIGAGVDNWVYGLTIGDGNLFVSGDFGHAGVLKSPGFVSVKIPATNTITFPAIPKKTYGDAVFNLSATATSGLTVSYTSSDPTIASISGNKVTIHKVGTVSITAKDAGNEKFDPAKAVSQELVVNPKKLTISVADETITVGDPDPTWEISYSGFATGDTKELVTGLKVTRETGTAAKTYAITLSGAKAPNYEITYEDGTLTIKAKGSSILPQEIGQNGTFETQIRKFPHLVNFLIRSSEATMVKVMIYDLSGQEIGSCMSVNRQSTHDLQWSIPTTTSSHLIIKVQATTADGRVQSKSYSIPMQE